MLFAAQEVRIGKKTLLKTSDTVFLNTDPLRPANKGFSFSLRYCFDSNFCVEFQLKTFSLDLLYACVGYFGHKKRYCLHNCLTLC